MKLSVDPLDEIAIPADAAQYFPPLSGRYEVKPGLLPLGRDSGNGEKDGQLFQFDSGSDQYRRAAEICRSHRSHSSNVSRTLWSRSLTSNGFCRKSMPGSTISWWTTRLST